MPRFGLRAFMIAIAIAAVVAVGVMQRRKALTYPPEGDVDVLTPAAMRRLVRDDIASVAVEFDGVHGLWGGTSVRVAGDGTVSALFVRPPRDGENGTQERRREGRLDAARTRALFQSILDGGALEVRRTRNVGIPDEGTPKITLSATVNGRPCRRWVWLLSGEARETPAFANAREALLKVAQEVGE